MTEFVTYQGDALARLAELPSEHYDAVITDPPYSSGGTFRSDRQQATGQKYTQTGEKKNPFSDFPGDNRDGRSFLYWMTLVLSETYRVTKNGGTIALFTDWRQLPTVSDALQAAGFVWRGVYVWDKTLAARPRKGYFRQQAEFVVWGSKGPLPAKPELPALPGLTTCSVNKGGRFHQTGKPVELMKAIVQVCPEGGTVLDPFMGSGSTGVACGELGRKFHGIEYTDHYHEVARERLAQAFQ